MIDSTNESRTIAIASQYIYRTYIYGLGLLLLYSTLHTPLHSTPHSTLHFTSGIGDLSSKADANEVAGWVTVYTSGLTFATIKGAGHLVPAGGAVVCSVLQCSAVFTILVILPCTHCFPCAYVAHVAHFAHSPFIQSDRSQHLQSSVPS